MTYAAITQEELFLPLVRFIADRGGEIDRQRDELLDALADRLGLTGEERNRTTDQGRDQWRSTVEWSRYKLIEGYEAIEQGETGIWRLSPEGWRLAEHPPTEWLQAFEEWKKNRTEARPDDAPAPPDRPSGFFKQRLEQMRESLEMELHEALRRKRNGALARAIKEEYDYRCQFCDPRDPECPRIPIGNGQYYVEAHHIEGLAEVSARAEHGQVDDSEYQNLTSYHNVVVVCPYHHRLLHHHHPPFEFDPEEMLFYDDEATIVEIRVRHRPHLEGFEPE